MDRRPTAAAKRTRVFFRRARPGSSATGSERLRAAAAMDSLGNPVGEPKKEIGIHPEQRLTFSFFYDYLCHIITAN